VKAKRNGNGILDGLDSGGEVSFVGFRAGVSGRGASDGEMGRIVWLARAAWLPVAAAATQHFHFGLSKITTSGKTKNFVERQDTAYWDRAQDILCKYPILRDHVLRNVFKFLYPIVLEKKSSIIKM
jgi:hypothetical protein